MFFQVEFHVDTSHETWNTTARIQKHKTRDERSIRLQVRGAESWVSGRPTCSMGPDDKNQKHAVLSVDVIPITQKTKDAEISN